MKANNNMTPQQSSKGLAPNINKTANQSQEITKDQKHKA